MLQITVPWYFKCVDSFQLKPVIIRDKFGTEIWFLYFYLALELGGKAF